ncbi:hypothetical protein [Ralstonia phage RP13]|nr:hypothetical protein [Ralstonia phage RP13]
MNAPVNLEQVTKLAFPDNIRLRQGMFGSDGETADIDLRELIDNGVDLVLKARISLAIKAFTNIDGYHGVVDNGPGLPLYNDPDYHDDEDLTKQRPITVDLLSQINVGTNFKRTSYSAGMNGVGTKLTNALADSFIVFVNAAKKDVNTLTSEMQQAVRDGETVFRLEFAKGILQQMSMICYEDLNHSVVPANLGGWLKANVPEDFGTCVVFKPDPTLHASCDAKYHGYPFKIMRGLFHHDQDFKDVNVSFSLNGKDIPPLDFREVFKGDVFIEDRIFTESVSVKTSEPLPVKFIYQVAWNKDQFNSESDGSVNTLKTPSGRHINIVQAGVTAAFNRYNNLITGQDSRLGMRLFVASFGIEPLFNSQDKTKLSSYQDVGFDESAAIKAIGDSFLKVMKDNAEFFDLIVARILEYKKMQKSMSNIDLLKSSIVMGDEGDKRRAMSGDMARVYEATSRDFAKRELYITEGKSASQGIVELRSKLFQSVLPLRGKLINTTGFDEQDLTDNGEILAIINTIGCGIGAITDVTKSRYGKVIIATDADSDGAHIANLIVALFYNHAPEVIKAGMLYKLETPYYRVQAGDKREFFYYEEKDKIDFEKHTVRKLKGLGSWDSRKNPAEVEKYLLKPESRRLIQITYDEVDEFITKEASRLFSSSLARKSLMEQIGVLCE